MSADAISTCPKCKENMLREYHDIGVIEAANLELAGRRTEFVLLLDFSAECRQCGFTFGSKHIEDIRV